MNYKVGSETFESFSKAVAYAGSINENVFGIRESRVVWTPAPPVSAKKMRMYRERLAAYRAQENHKIAKLEGI